MEQEYPELEPISEQAPTGTDVRYEPEFEQLQAEIDKLSSPSATSGVDWAKVKTLASQILRNQSKDLLVASYFAVAGFRLNRLQGLAEGLGVVAGVLELYWETLFPSKKRMRGRIAAITWLLEKSESSAETIEFEPADPDAILVLTQIVGRIDSVLQQHLDDAPLLRPIERIIEDIPVRQATTLEEPDAPQEQKRSQPAERETGENEDRAAVPPDQTLQVTPAPSVPASDRVSAAEMEKIVRGAFQTIRQAADFYFDKDMSNQRGYRCRRVAGWAMIQSVPPAQDNQTQIPPPGEFEAVKLRLQELRSLEKWPELLRESEQRLNTALLWLDLNRFSADSLAGLGAQYQEAHDAICQETAFLLNRLPGLEKLKFADGSPLADAETRQWLETIRPESESSVSTTMAPQGMADEAMGKVLDEAKTLAAGKKIAEAARLLAHELARSSGGHERLLWRLGLAQLLIQSRQLKIVRPHLDEIVSDIERYRIEEWEPALAIHSLRVAWLGYRGDKGARETADEILARIARLDPVEAMQLEKR